ncbi:MAG: ArgP/LysG family DNA-binding transcriptional regulator [Glaciihabitans sp.]|nr:ArgP/LysG family DNA-binding transcriptional regulator [Glaciihabitans sp.]
MAEVDIGQLRALAAVVDAGSFEHAATALHLTPSAVSQRIKALETSAGRVLVQRSKPSVVTEAGQPYLRLARQLSILLEDARAEATEGTGAPISVPLAVNGDSLTTWVLPALATLADRVSFDIHREDQDHSAALLRAGTVIAAITSDAEAIQGCSVTRLGIMRYRALASPSFAARWFPVRARAEHFAVAPVMVYDRKDDLQDRFLSGRYRSMLSPPRHYMPGSADFAESVRLGMGWGMLPDQQSAALEAAGQLVDLAPGEHLDVSLYWQQWTLETPILDLIAEAILRAARETLR